MTRASSCEKVSKMSRMNFLPSFKLVSSFGPPLKSHMYHFYDLLVTLDNLMLPCAEFNIGAVHVDKEKGDQM